MFRCVNCNKVSESGEKGNKIVTEKRDKVYYFTLLEEFGRTQLLFKKIEPKDLKETQNIVDEKETKGWEIVKEILVCSKCKEELINVGK